LNKEKRELIHKTVEVLDRLIKQVDELSSSLKKEFIDPEGVYTVDENGNCVLEKEDKDED